eukprot:CAMPEP_0114985770 /NCGR_PEP_ID=MMETSP0216-20121206/8054_1 /TAXON_ID=223996 /ORGANISM="Protocruzia adherens, Strain Boccale" /LENGTH=297 /DNA_ID=CAMNT_0002348129 /DNA_START=131 /DNA_END=1024 /DNA_ORIENTATION=-
MESQTLKVAQLIQGIEQPEGDGATVVRLIGSANLRRLDPFLMLDHFRVKLPSGFPDHPHRGFETVTYQLHGETHHEDFKGNYGKITPGDVQWMTAGKGIVHAEIPGSFDEESIGLQLWVNLAAKDKFCEPRYQDMLGDTIPVAEKEGVKVKIIAGSSMGVGSSTFTKTPTVYLDVTMEPNSQFTQKINAGWNTAVYILSGSVDVGDKTLTKLQFAVMEKGESDSTLLLKTGTDKVRAIVLSGQPLNEPVFNYGPFVLSSQEDLQKAFSDYQRGKNGFENAATWESKIKNKRYERDSL